MAGTTGTAARHSLERLRDDTMTGCYLADPGHAAQALAYAADRTFSDTA
ncbi:hypothetical protein [Prauserella sp. PE36]|nr:hypothetical protein [Prauserella sp. PE36]